MFKYIKFLILLIGIGAFFAYYVKGNELIGFILGLIAPILKIYYVKNGGKSVIATIGGYIGIIAAVPSLFGLMYHIITKY